MKEAQINIKLDGKGGLVIKQQAKGKWDVLEEIAVFEVLKMRAIAKLKKVIDIKKTKQKEE